jgi:hypothetical protein
VAGRCAWEGTYLLVLDSYCYSWKCFAFLFNLSCPTWSSKQEVSNPASAIDPTSIFIDCRWYGSILIPLGLRRINWLDYQ